MLNFSRASVLLLLFTCIAFTNYGGWVRCSGKVDDGGLHATPVVDPDYGKHAERSRTDDEAITKVKESMNIDGFTADQLKDLSAKSEQKGFETEINRIMNIIIHSLYKDRDIFLRELISNASDALDKIRLLALQEPEQFESNPEMSIRIKVDIENKILTIADTGIGMTKGHLEQYLGTIAKSQTNEFLDAIETQANMTSSMTNDLIGQFGVGFYSAFLIADKVMVTSKHNNDDDQHIFISDSKSYSVTRDPRGNTLKRGTVVTLYLKEDAEEFAEPYRIKQIIRSHSQFINYPIYLWSSKEVEEEDEEVPADVDQVRNQDEDNDSTKDEGSEDVKIEKDEEETLAKPTTTKTTVKKKKIVKFWDHLNNIKPIWLRPSQDITKEEYHDFYKSWTKKSDDPLTYAHFFAEGEISFKSIIFIPNKAPPQYQQTLMKGRADNVKLYVRRVYIGESIEDLLPGYLSFIKAIIDSDDLPINVSRETLQHKRLLILIKRKLTKKIFSILKSLEKDVYNERFWKEFGTSIKMGVLEDETNRLQLAKLLRFYSSESPDKFISLEEYVSRMKKDQQSIFYLAARSVEEAKRSAFAERLIEQGYEVLYLVDAVDEFCLQNIPEFSRKTFQNVAKEGLKLLKGDSGMEEYEAMVERMKPLTKWIQNTFSDVVLDATPSERLVNTTMVFIATRWGYDGRMEQISRAQAYQKVGGDSTTVHFSHIKRKLEINARHPIIKSLLEKVKDNPDDTMLREYAQVLINNALLRSGYELKNSVLFASQVEDVIRLAMQISPDASFDKDYIGEALSQAAEMPENKDARFLAGIKILSVSKDPASGKTEKKDIERLTVRRRRKSPVEEDDAISVKPIKKLEKRKKSENSSKHKKDKRKFAREVKGREKKGRAKNLSKSKCKNAVVKKKIKCKKPIHKEDRSKRPHKFCPVAGLKKHQQHQFNRTMLNKNSDRKQGKHVNNSIESRPHKHNPVGLDRNGKPKLENTVTNAARNVNVSTTKKSTPDKGRSATGKSNSEDAKHTSQKIHRSSGPFRRFLQKMLAYLSIYPGSVVEDEALNDVSSKKLQKHYNIPIRTRSMLAYATGVKRTPSTKADNFAGKKKQKRQQILPEGVRLQDGKLCVGFAYRYRIGNFLKSKEGEKAVRALNLDVPRYEKPVEMDPASDGEAGKSKSSTILEAVIKKPPVGYAYRYRISKMLHQLDISDLNSLQISGYISSGAAVDLLTKERRRIGSGVLDTQQPGPQTLLRQMAQGILWIISSQECVEWRDLPLSMLSEEQTLRVIKAAETSKESSEKQEMYGKIGFKYRYRKSNMFKATENAREAAAECESVQPGLAPTVGLVAHADLSRQDVGYRYRYRVSRMLETLNVSRSDMMVLLASNDWSAYRADREMAAMDRTTEMDDEFDEKEVKLVGTVNPEEVSFPVVELYPIELHSVGYEYRYRRSRKMKELGISAKTIEEKRWELVEQQLKQNMTNLIDRSSIGGAEVTDIDQVNKPLEGLFVLDYSKLTDEERKVGYEYRYRVNRKFMKVIPQYLKDDLMKAQTDNSGKDRPSKVTRKSEDGKPTSDKPKLFIPSKPGAKRTKKAKKIKPKTSFWLDTIKKQLVLSWQSSLKAIQANIDQLRRFRTPSAGKQDIDDEEEEEDQTIRRAIRKLRRETRRRKLHKSIEKSKKPLKQYIEAEIETDDGSLTSQLESGDNAPIEHWLHGTVGHGPRDNAAIDAEEVEHHMTAVDDETKPRTSKVTPRRRKKARSHGEDRQLPLDSVAQQIFEDPDGDQAIFRSQPHIDDQMLSESEDGQHAVPFEDLSEINDDENDLFDEENGPDETIETIEYVPEEPAYPSEQSAYFSTVETAYAPSEEHAYTSEEPAHVPHEEPAYTSPEERAHVPHEEPAYTSYDDPFHGRAYEEPAYTSPDDPFHSRAYEKPRHVVHEELLHVDPQDTDDDCVSSKQLLLDGSIKAEHDVKSRSYTSLDDDDNEARLDEGTRQTQHDQSGDYRLVHDYLDGSVKTSDTDDDVQLIHGRYLEPPDEPTISIATGTNGSDDQASATEENEEDAESLHVSQQKTINRAPSRDEPQRTSPTKPVRMVDLNSIEITLLVEALFMRLRDEFLLMVGIEDN